MTWINCFPGKSDKHFPWNVIILKYSTYTSFFAFIIAKMIGYEYTDIIAHNIETIKLKKNISKLTKLGIYSILLWIIVISPFIYTELLMSWKSANPRVFLDCCHQDTLRVLHNDFTIPIASGDAKMQHKKGDWAVYPYLHAQSNVRHMELKKLKSCFEMTYDHKVYNNHKCKIAAWS